MCVCVCVKRVLCLSAQWRLPRLQLSRSGSVFPPDCGRLEMQHARYLVLLARKIVPVHTDLRISHLRAIYVVSSHSCFPHHHNTPKKTVLPLLPLYLLQLVVPSIMYVHPRHPSESCVFLHRWLWVAAFIAGQFPEAYQT